MDSVNMIADNTWQLFVDDWSIERHQGVTRRWHKPERISEEPVLKADQPWEERPYFTYSNYTVLEDEQDGKVKCYYEDISYSGASENSRILYAESADGIHFTKPVLDIASYKGEKTNIVMGNVGMEPDDHNPWSDVGVHSCGIVIDRHPQQPQQRFRALFSRAHLNDQGKEVHVIQCAHSADGLHWIPYEERPMLGSSGSHLSDVACPFYDENSRCFVMNTRHGAMYRTGVPVSGMHSPYSPEFQNHRRVFQTYSHDFLHWSEPMVVSSPQEDFDNLDEHHYGMAQFKVGNMHFATVGIFQLVDNTMETRLLYSRDGLHFQPADRGNAFMKPRGEGFWDAYMVTLCAAPVVRNGKMLFYYGGAKPHHDFWSHADMAKSGLPECVNPMDNVKYGMGIGVLRQHGFCSLQANRWRAGYVITRALYSLGTKLYINARCGNKGSIKVEVLDACDRVISGCSFDECVPFAGDSVEAQIVWNHGAVIDMPSTNYGYRKLHFRLLDAEIFSFRFGD